MVFSVTYSLSVFVRKVIICNFYIKDCTCSGAGLHWHLKLVLWFAYTLYIFVVFFVYIKFLYIIMCLVKNLASEALMSV